MITAVIFDWDGTLVESKKIIASSFIKVLNEFGLSVNEKEIIGLMGPSASIIFKQVLSSLNVDFTEELVEKLARERVIAEINFSRKIRLNAGAYEILNNLKGKVSLALASMNNKEVIRKHLETCQIARYFETVLSADEVREPKPNPEIFLKCSAKLGIRVSECVVIEDSVSGIKAAKKAKMKCIAVTTGISSRSQIEKEYPDLIVSSLIEKNPILNFILKQ